MAKRQRRKRRERRREHSRRDGWQTRHSVITGAGIAATATLGIAGSAVADSHAYYVGTNADTPTTATDCDDPANTDCTLRNAVDAANANSGYLDYVVFTSNVSGTVTLSGTDILIEDPVRIYGFGTAVISGNDNSRIFDIDMQTTGDEVSLYGLTLEDGSEALGGAIYDKNAYLTVVESVLTGNDADTGGAIYEYGGFDNGRSMVVAYSTLDHNTADFGGAIAGGYSAGIIGGSTLAANTASTAGGGVVNFDGDYGASLFDSTISGNSSANAGGGVRTAYLYAYNTIVANSSAPTDTFDLYLYGVGSLIETPGSALYGSSNITGVDPQLGGLANNGGITPTLKPAASSPVVDKGFSFAYYDQRGFPFARIVDNPNANNTFGPPYGAADIGSVELTLAEGPQPQPPVSNPVPPGPSFNLKKAIKRCKKKFPHNKVKRKKCIRRAKRRARASASGMRDAAPAIAHWRARAEANVPERHWGTRAWKFER